MSLVDEVLAKHGGDTYNCAGCLPNFAVSPCESVRLALSLRAADIAIESFETTQAGILQGLH